MKFDFNECIRSGVNQAMKECEITIGMTLREAVERQIPKKPTEIDEIDETDFYYLAFVCPSCETPNYGQPYRPNHCKHCGQKIDWSEA